LKSSGDGKPAPVLVAGEAGKGRTLALLTDSAWNWGFFAAGEGDDGRAFQRFWENAIRWLVRDPALTLLRLELDRLEYRRNQPIAVRVRAMHADYSPAPAVEVVLTVVSTAAPADAEPARTLRATTDADGEAHVDVGTLPPGAYRLTGRANIDARSVTHDETFVVRAGGPELDDVAARDKVLREIAQASGGSYAFEELRDVAIRSSREGARRPPAIRRDLVDAGPAPRRRRAPRPRVDATAAHGPLVRPVSGRARPSRAARGCGGSAG
jgi:hypothetical protein